jgi:hypothetical protein
LLTRVTIYKIFARSYVRAEQLDAAVRFYEELTHEQCGLRYESGREGIRAAVVGGIHIVAGAEAGLYDHSEVRATYLVDHVDQFIDPLLRLGGEIVEEPSRGPQGHSMIVRHPDGLLVEYVDGETD